MATGIGRIASQLRNESITPTFTVTNSGRVGVTAL